MAEQAAATLPEWKCKKRKEKKITDWMDQISVKLISSQDKDDSDFY